LKQVYIDTETTGINPKDNGLIQISGMIEIDSQMVKEFDFRVKPFLGDKIEDEALKVNGITREDLEKFESPDLVFEKLIALFNQYVNPYDKSDKFFFIAYNARFDWDFLSNFFLKNNHKYFSSYFFFPQIDVMYLAAEKLKSVRASMQNFKLQSVAEALGIQINKDLLHDAKYDIELTRLVYQKVTEIKTPVIEKKVEKDYTESLF